MQNELLLAPQTFCCVLPTAACVLRNLFSLLPPGGYEATLDVVDGLIIAPRLMCFHNHHFQYSWSILFPLPPECYKATLDVLGLSGMLRGFSFPCLSSSKILLLPLSLPPGGYEATLDVLGLSGMQKVTARLIEGIEIQQVRHSWD
jgi:hypothetical protein